MSKMVKGIKEKKYALKEAEQTLHRKELENGMS